MSLIDRSSTAALLEQQRAEASTEAGDTNNGTWLRERASIRELALKEAIDVVRSVESVRRASVCTSCGSIKASDPTSNYFSAGPRLGLDSDWDGCSAGSGT